MEDGRLSDDENWWQKDEDDACDIGSVSAEYCWVAEAAEAATGAAAISEEGMGSDELKDTSIILWLAVEEYNR